MNSNEDEDVTRTVRGETNFPHHRSIPDSDDNGKNSSLFYPSVKVSSLILAIVSFILGRWFSLSIIYTLIIIVILYLWSWNRVFSPSSTSSSSSLDGSGSRTFTQFLSIPPELRPSWLMYPDFERAQFVDSFVQSIWPRLQNFNSCVKSVLNTHLSETLITSSTSSSSTTAKGSKISTMANFFIAEIVCDDFYLGELPVEILGIKAYPQRTTYILDTQIRWKGNSSLNISLYLHYLPRRFSIPISIENIELEGTLRMELSFSTPTIEFTHIDLSFLSLPRMDMDFRTASINLMMFPLLHRTLEQLFKNSIFRTMLYPLSIHLPLSAKTEQVQGGTTVASSPLAQNNIPSSSHVLSSKGEATSETATSGTNIASSVSPRSIHLPINMNPPINFSIGITGLTFHRNDNKYTSSPRSQNTPKICIEGILLSSFDSVNNLPSLSSKPKPSWMAISEFPMYHNLHPLRHLRRRSFSVNNLLDTNYSPSSTFGRSIVDDKTDSFVDQHYRGNHQVFPRSRERVSIHQLSNNDLWFYYTGAGQHTHDTKVIQTTENQYGYKVTFLTILSFTSKAPHTDILLLRLVQVPNQPLEEENLPFREQCIGYIRIPCLQIMEHWYMNNGTLPITLTLPLESVSIYDTFEPLYKGQISLEISLQRQLSSYEFSSSSVIQPEVSLTNNVLVPSIKTLPEESKNNSDSFSLHEIEPDTLLSPGYSTGLHGSFSNEALSMSLFSGLTPSHQEALRLAAASPKTEQEKEEQHQKIMRLPPEMLTTMEEETVTNAVSNIVHHSMDHMKEKLRSIFHPPNVSFIGSSLLTVNSSPPVPITTETSTATALTATAGRSGGGLVSLESIPLLQITGAHLLSSTSSSTTSTPSHATSLSPPLSSSSMAPNPTLFRMHPPFSNLPSIAFGSSIVSPPSSRKENSLSSET